MDFQLKKNLQAIPNDLGIDCSLIR